MVIQRFMIQSMRLNEIFICLLTLKFLKQFVLSISVDRIFTVSSCPLSSFYEIKNEFKTPISDFFLETQNSQISLQVQQFLQRPSPPVWEHCDQPSPCSVGTL